MATTFKAIATVTVGSGGASNIEFTSIAATYTDLCILLSARSNRSAVSDPVNLEFNGSTTSDTSIYLEGDGSSASSGNAGGTQTEIARVPGASATSSTFGNALIYVPNYAGSQYKSSSGDSVTENNATSAYAKLSAGLWSNTSAITSVKLISQTGNLFVQYSTATLYGIKNS